MASVTVGLRLRPMGPTEAHEGRSLAIDGDSVIALDTDPVHTGGPWTFDHAMDSTNLQNPTWVGNEQCYELMGRPLLDRVLEGYNVCLFCYGQTGTGKTATLMGDSSTGKGILPRFVEELMAEVGKLKEQGASVTTEVQMLEVYNEQIHDLLFSEQTAKPPLVDVRLVNGVGQITGAESRPVHSAVDCMHILQEGNSRRVVAATLMNPQSSRGHTIFRLRLEKSGGEDHTKISSDCYFADLAGHENERTTQVTGIRFTELSHINKSLMYLERCLHAMAVSSRLAARRSSSASKRLSQETFMFRNSKLTMILANALHGNSQVSVLVTATPATCAFDQSLSSLRFGADVKCIQRDVTANVSGDSEALVAHLQDEVKKLKKQLHDARLVAKLQVEAARARPGLPEESEPEPQGVTAKQHADAWAILTACSGFSGLSNLKERCERLSAENVTLRLQVLKYQAQLQAAGHQHRLASSAVAAAAASAKRASAAKGGGKQTGSLGHWSSWLWCGHEKQLAPPHSAGAPLCQGHVASRDLGWAGNGRSGTRGAVHMLAVALDYKGTAAPLTCTVDAVNMSALATACGVTDLVQLFDKDATKRKIKREVERVGQLCAGRPDDVFVIFYAGHGTSVDDLDRDERDLKDEAFVLCDDGGQAIPPSMESLLTDDEFSHMLTEHLPASTALYVISDCCHSGTICDFRRPVWGDRMAISISGCRDSQTSGDTGRGGICTHSLLMAIESMQAKTRGASDYSVDELFSECLRIDNQVFHSEQDITLNCSPSRRPGDFVWPLVPMQAYSAPYQDKPNFGAAGAGFQPFQEAPVSSMSIPGVANSWTVSDEEIAAWQAGAQYEPWGRGVSGNRTSHDAVVALGHNPNEPGHNPNEREASQKQRLAMIASRFAALEERLSKLDAIQHE